MSKRQITMPSGAEYSFFGDFSGSVEVWAPRESDEGCVDFVGEDAERWVKFDLDIRDLEWLIAWRKLEELRKIADATTPEDVLDGKVAFAIHGLPEALEK
jgi:hypothetical protein